MRPIVFSDHCQILMGAGDVGDLPVLTTHYYGLGKAIISCWRPAWWELLKLLLTRKVYVVILGQKQPPMIVTTDHVDLQIAETEKWHEAHAAAAGS